MLTCVSEQLAHGPSSTTNLEPVMNFPAGDAGSQFSSVRGVRSDEYGVSSSDDRRRNGRNWPHPFGLRRKSGHTCRRGGSSSAVEPATAFGFRLVWPDFRPDRKSTRL